MQLKSEAWNKQTKKKKALQVFMNEVYAAPFKSNYATSTLTFTT